MIPPPGRLVKVYPFGGENNEKENEHGILGGKGKALVHRGAEERHPQAVLQQHAGPNRTTGSKRKSGCMARRQHPGRQEEGGRPLCRVGGRAEADLRHVLCDPVQQIRRILHSSGVWEHPH